jgi:hypothetical protein
MLSTIVSQLVNSCIETHLDVFCQNIVNEQRFQHLQSLSNLSSSAGENGNRDCCCFGDAAKLKAIWRRQQTPTFQTFSSGKTPISSLTGTSASSSQVQSETWIFPECGTVQQNNNRDETLIQLGDLFSDVDSLSWLWSETPVNHEQQQTRYPNLFSSASDDNNKNVTQTVHEDVAACHFLENDPSSKMNPVSPTSSTKTLGSAVKTSIEQLPNFSSSSTTTTTAVESMKRQIEEKMGFAATRPSKRKQKIKSSDFHCNGGKCKKQKIRVETKQKKHSKLTDRDKDEEAATMNETPKHSPMNLMRTCWHVKQRGKAKGTVCNKPISEFDRFCAKHMSSSVGTAPKSLESSAKTDTPVTCQDQSENQQLQKKKTTAKKTPRKKQSSEKIEVQKTHEFQEHGDKVRRTEYSLDELKSFSNLSQFIDSFIASHDERSPGNDCQLSTIQSESLDISSVEDKQTPNNEKRDDTSENVNVESRAAINGRIGKHVLKTINGFDVLIEKL